jgi:hypothetical protein
MRATIRISAACVWLSLATVAASAQIGPVIDALTADRAYVIGITASISGYEQMTSIEKVRALRLYVYQHTPVGVPLVHDQVVNVPLNDAYAIFAKGGGVFCGGTSIMLSRVYKAAGFNSWLYDFGELETPDDGETTHETTLVEVDGQVILQDAYLNFEYVDLQGKPIPFLDVISRTAAGNPPTPTAGAVNRPWLFSSSDESEMYIDHKDAMRCKDAAVGVTCPVIITLSRFLEVDSGILDHLELRGYPRQMEYLMLYPLALVSMYSDGVPRAESLLSEVKRIAGNPLKRKAP